MELCGMTTTHEPSTRDALDQGMTELWLKSRPGVLERVRVLECAVLALRLGQLTEPARADAERAAHKLAGIAGTFGYWNATELAREAEAALSVDTNRSPEIVGRLGEIASVLYAQLSAALP
jgi:HPt (histidine-containing phosphotransfer) domain-containing protein